jgi:hypothetical protein
MMYWCVSGFGKVFFRGLTQRRTVNSSNTISFSDFKFRPINLAVSPCASSAYCLFEMDDTNLKREMRLEIWSKWMPFQTVRIMGKPYSHQKEVRTSFNLM